MSGTIETNTSSQSRPGDERAPFGKHNIKKLAIFTPAILAACSPVLAGTETPTLPPPAVGTGVPSTEVPTNPGITSTVAPTESATKVPEIVPVTAIDYLRDELFINAQYGSILELSGDKLLPKNNIPLDPANEAQWILNAQNNANLVTNRTSSTPTATYLFTNGQPDGASRNAAMSFSGSSIWWPTYTEGQSTFLSSSPSEYWFPVQVNQSKVTYTKVNLPAGYTPEDVRMGWIGDNQSVELAAKGGKGMMLFNPTTHEWRELQMNVLEEQPAAIQAANVYANVLTRAGNPTTAEQILQQGLATIEMTGRDGKIYEVATTQDGIPMMIKVEGGEWESATWSNVSVQGQQIGTEASRWYIKNDSDYKKLIMDNFNFVITSSVFQPDLWVDIQGENLTPEQIVGMYNWTKADDILSVTGADNIPVRIHNLFGEVTTSDAPSWLTHLSNTQIEKWMDLNAKAVSDRVKLHGVTVYDIDMYNEIFNRGEVNDYIAQRLGADRVLLLSSDIARKYFGENVPLNYSDNVFYGTQTNDPNNNESQIIFNEIQRLVGQGVKIDKVSDHGHKSIKDFKTMDDVTNYLNELRALSAQYAQIGVKFELGESDINIHGATPEQLRLANEIIKGEIGLLNEGVLSDLGFWGFVPDVSWMNPGNGFPSQYDTAPVPLMPFEADHKTPTMLYYEILRALIQN
ncbi:MAG: endo-1,4-beta-xylanase [Candidatus Roizmanbacteria bacterium]|nr:endo-1,4-beta-xylanase [Candidatus Roizmanbacteria bacterium]